MASDLIASEEDLRKFGSAAIGQRQVTPALKGVVAEIATAGVLRYPWDMLKPLLAELMEKALLDFEAEAHVEVGPSPAGTTPEAAKHTKKHLAELLAGCSRGAPFTLQRFAELLLEPRKQFSRLDKLALALEKLLMVVSIQQQATSPPPRPRISALPLVNENPEPPELPTATANRDREQPRSPRANGALANGGEEAARSAFTSQMHAAAETAFINSVLVADGNGAADAGLATAAEASPMQADSSAASPARAPAAAAGEAATAVAASSAAAATASPDGSPVKQDTTGGRGDATLPELAVSSAAAEEPAAASGGDAASTAVPASQSPVSADSAAAGGQLAAGDAAGVDAAGDTVMADVAPADQAAGQAVRSSEQQAAKPANASLACGEKMQQ